MKKNILVVDDSALMRRLLSDIINSDDRFMVSKVAFNGLEALDYVTTNYRNVDGVVLDINMPKMNGLEFLERISKLNIRLTVIIVSTIAKEGAKETIQALELGAFDFVTKPESFIEAKGNDFKDRLINCLLLATGQNHLYQKTISHPTLQEQAKNVISVKEKVGSTFVYPDCTRAKPKVNMVKKERKPLEKDATKLVALACSTGGPKALQKVIPLLPKNLNASFLLVQHMPEGFTNSLAQRLNDMSELQVKEAVDGEEVQKGYVYIAKGGYQMRVKQQRDRYFLSVTLEAARGGLRPCADIMYESLVDSGYDEITCVILTGMGGDGTQGIKKLNENNNIYVIAQDEETCTVYGMPKVIAESGLVDEVVPLEKVAEAITNHVGVL
ncbi:chemotaxis-specific protein-glutamate methyltransferase CheB [Anaerosporobacter faecicola]|uniref:chemotaxis-specific protein-glutamate methyltransferase CheB n=1 Tax=Anaerosporobacter faecicola TaxID=2718714 RepID=UPI00143C421B|nr:chemotaxis-specific protein-glutamate methyltransferase CheB [Anaerosporobacter faecicola]